VDVDMQTLMVKARDPASSAPRAAPRGEPGIADIVRSTAADVVHLATAELRLAKAEIKDGVRTQASRAIWLVGGALPLAVGYLLGVAALVTWVRPLLGLTGALAAVALSQAALGGIIVTVASPRLGPRQWRERNDASAASPERGGDAGA